MTQELWTDGGCILKNPSPLGGTWAWVLVEDGREVARSSGLLMPETVGVPNVSNNVSELCASLRALMHNPNFGGTLFTDSKVTMHRLTDGSSFEGVPQWMRLRCLELRRCRRWDVRLVKGHPTAKELRNGDGSRWNVLADEACRKEAERFLRNRKVRA